MPEHSQGKRAGDLDQIAAQIFAEATNEVRLAAPKPEESPTALQGLERVDVWDEKIPRERFRR